MQTHGKKHVWPNTIPKLAVLGLALGLCAELALPQSISTTTSTPTATTSGITILAKDPGVRGGAPGAGGPLAGLGSTYGDFFTSALGRFQEVDSVSGTVANEEGNGVRTSFQFQ